MSHAKQRNEIYLSEEVWRRRTTLLASTQTPPRPHPHAEGLRVILLYVHLCVAREGGRGEDVDKGEAGVSKHESERQRGK